jgi:hypothetical protein
LVPRHEHAGVRRRPYGNYLIFYRVGIGIIEVVHILHGAQDYETILFSELENLLMKARQDTARFCCGV